MFFNWANEWTPTLKETSYIMKKILSMTLGLALVFGLASFASDDKKHEDKKHEDKKDHKDDKKKKDH